MEGFVLNFIINPLVLLNGLEQILMLPKLQCKGLLIYINYNVCNINLIIALTNCKKLA